MERLKLIWDFRGPDAQKIASHHEIHLKDYAFAKALKNTITGVEEISTAHYSAYMVVEKSKMKVVRDALKPHRGQIYTEK